MRRYDMTFAVRAVALLLGASLCLGGCQVAAPVPEQGESAHTTTTVAGAGSDTDTTATTTSTASTDTADASATEHTTSTESAPSTTQSTESVPSSTQTSQTSRSTTITTTQSRVAATVTPSTSGDTPATVAPPATVTPPVTVTPPATVTPLTAPVYPEQMAFPLWENYQSYKEYQADLKAYQARRNEQAALGRRHASSLNGYLTTAVPQLLRNEAQQNRVISPLNIYFALGMLTEITAGDTRRQLMNVLGASDQTTLRDRVSDMWNATYKSDDTVTGLLASSLWLRDDFGYHPAPLTQLAETYYAATYRGKMGDSAYNGALQKWLNENTGGRLSDYVSKQTLDPMTAIALVNAVNFRAKWEYGFSEKRTVSAPFYAPDDTVTCDFMNSSRMKISHVVGKGFSAVALPMENSGYMWVFLPDEGVSPDVLPAQQAVWDVTRFKTSATGKEVNLSLPKFDISSQIDLRGGLKALGATDVMDEETADFSPLLGKHRASLGKVDHAARVTVDEEGCEAAAFTVMQVTIKGVKPNEAETVDFVVDRPFFFVITGEGDLPLFAGTVYNP